MPSLLQDALAAVKRADGASQPHSSACDFPSNTWLRYQFPQTDGADYRGSRLDGGRMGPAAVQPQCLFSWLIAQT
jgi:hypothetical protein